MRVRKVNSQLQPQLGHITPNLPIKNDKTKNTQPTIEITRLPKNENKPPIQNKLKQIFSFV
ncbi:hypothetical protein CWB63_06475 [Pseudoalteromonas sp. S409]|nr:hypothetical protein CWB64_11730 [Pseudoalteromonas sp. S410]TMN89219.1 hypothetical protein CWB62_12720 [Pseudoalteromonas sp. S408]TMN94997.1 hypothetical protein CWB61_15615 [Pseudoalteromonas sp. S407]TMO00705.1 hypothetical protein CWB63_06475 [Pseudoalteromonas sp. S409]TMO09506.1 hypothetical protein CWB57_12185 [Pseudoalteromonas sp. S186]TMO13568.1 hypothetical protein CWB56_16045 [Pseudoalteromonas sp. S185]